MDRPNEYGARLHRLEGAQGSSEGCDWAGFRLRVLHDDAIVAGQHRLNTGSVWPKHDHSCLYLERFQSLQDSHDERETEEIQQRSEEHTSELQSRLHLVCRLLLEK